MVLGRGVAEAVPTGRGVLASTVRPPGGALRSPPDGKDQGRAGRGQRPPPGGSLPAGVSERGLRAGRAVAQGGSVIDPMVVDELVRSRSGQQQPGMSSLTPRESEILAEMAQGKSNAAIAASLSVSERAVEKHTNSIFAKLGLSEEKDLNRRVKAVLLYLAEGKGG